MINAKEFDIDPSSWEVDVIHIGQSQNRLLKVKNFFSNWKCDRITFNGFLK